MEDEKTKEGSVTSPSSHPSTSFSPKKVDVENTPQNGNDEIIKISQQNLDIPITSKQNLPINLEPLENNNGNKIEALENNNGNKIEAKVDLPNNLKQLKNNNRNIEANVNVPNNLEQLENNNENKKEAKLDVPNSLEPLENDNGNKTEAQPENSKETKKRLLSISYSSPTMKLKDAANAPSSRLSMKERSTYSSSPIAPVKQTVSRFGGIIDWKAHKQHTLERRKFIQLELEKANEEIPVFKKQCEAAEEDKQQVLKKLSSTKRVDEDLKLNLERAQVEEQQAKQDAELAILRMEELEKGIADESSVACKAQLELVRARYDAAVADLKIVQAELEQLQRDFTLLSVEKASAIEKAKEAVSKCKQVEKNLEDSSIELINTKDSLESAQAGHLEAEELRADETMALEQEVVKFENELREADEELQKLNIKFSSAQNVKAQLVTSLELLKELKDELNVYMESNLKKDKDENHEKNRAEIEAAVKSTKKELEQTRANIKKATDEVNCLKESASSLNSELETQKSEIISVASIQEKEKDIKQKILELPKKLLQATNDANKAKSLVESSSKEYIKAKEEARQANNEKNISENRILTVQKEIELAKAASKLASDSINMQQERESSEIIEVEDSKTEVTLSLEDYYELNMRALEAEDEANRNVLIALSEIDAAKESEEQSINRLKEVYTDISYTKKELELALQKVKIAKEGKLYVEEELRKWRTKQQMQKAAEEEQLKAEKKKQTGNSIKTTSENRTSRWSRLINPGHEEKTTKKKKRLSFPRFFMFMGKRKSSSPSKPS